MGRSSGGAIGRVAALAVLLNAPAARAQPAEDASENQIEEDDSPEMRLLQEADLETLLKTPIEVWTATKTVQKSYDAPSIITTVTRDQIAVWGYRTLAELLGHMLGFYVIDDHITPNVAVRGTSGGLFADSSIIKVLIDGQSVAFSSTGGNALGPELIPLSAIDRVEIIRGPGSALYGADAFLGVVNIKTRSGRGLYGAAGVVGVGRVGNHLSHDVDVSAGAARGMVDVLLAFRHSQQDLSGLALPASSPAPNIPAYNTGAREARGLDQDSSTALAKVTLRPRPGSELAAFAYYSAMERGAEFGSLFQLANGANDRGFFSENRVTRWQLRSGLGWEQALGAHVRLSLHGQYFQGGPTDENRLEVGSDFYYVRRRFGFRGADNDLNVQWAPLASLRLVGGVSLLVDDELLPSRVAIAKQQTPDLKVGDVIAASSVWQGRQTFVNEGVYGQGTWNPLGSKLGLTAGVRYDQHSLYHGQLSRRIGAVSSPRPNLHFKLLHGTAFKAPSPLLLYAVASASGDVVGNPNLKPQYVSTSELQVAWERGRWLDLSSDVAYSVVDDKTEFIQQGIDRTARNVAHSATWSWESELELKPRDWLQGHLSFELQHTEERTGQEGYLAQVVGGEAGIYPRMMIHAGLAVQPPRLLRAAVVASYIGVRRASETNIVLNRGPYTLAPYVLLDAKLSTPPLHVFRGAGQQIAVALSGKNLLGAAGPMPGFSGIDYPLAPRTLLLEMQLSL